jgi:Ser/Thr protein kinase RdoA (MazF antagonist)
LLRQYGKAFYLDGIRAYERLQKLPFSRFVWEERQRHSLTHRDLASHNWLWEANGNIWLIDFETADYDAQIGDLWQMVSRVMAEQNGLSGWFDHAMKEYQLIRPLSSEERTYLSILVAFPNEFFREVIGLVEQKRGYSLKASLPYLKRLGNNRKKMHAEIRNLFYW